MTGLVPGNAPRKARSQARAERRERRWQETYQSEIIRIYILLNSATVFRVYFNSNLDKAKQKPNRTLQT